MKKSALLFLLVAATSATAGEMKITETDSGIVVEYTGTQAAQKGGEAVAVPAAASQAATAVPDAALQPQAAVAPEVGPEPELAAAATAATSAASTSGAADDGVAKVKAPQSVTSTQSASVAQLRNRRQEMRKEVSELKALRMSQQ